jgi:hypothetical protein
MRLQHQRAGGGLVSPSEPRFFVLVQMQGQQTILRTRCDDFNKESKGLRCQRGSIPAEALPPTSTASLLSTVAAGGEVCGETTSCCWDVGSVKVWTSGAVEGTVAPDENWIPP